MAKKFPAQEDIKQDLIEVIKQTINSKEYKKPDSNKENILSTNLMDKGLQNYSSYLIYYLYTEKLELEKAVEKTLEKVSAPNYIDKAIENDNITKAQAEIIKFFEYEKITKSKILDILDVNFDQVSKKLDWLIELRDHIDIYLEEGKIYIKNKISRRRLFSRKPRNKEFIKNLKSIRKGVKDKIKDLKDKRDNEVKDKSQSENNIGEKKDQNKGNDIPKQKIGGDGEPIKTKKRWNKIKEVKRIHEKGKNKGWSNKKIIDHIQSKNQDQYDISGYSKSTLETYFTKNYYPDFE